MLPRTLLLLGLAAAACGALGCATVQPWERGVLADRRMRAVASPDCEGARAHVLAVREGAAGGLGATGVACGCN